MTNIKANGKNYEAVELTGTEKEISYASSIRADFIGAWENMCNGKDREKIDALYGKAIDDLLNIEDSVFWIDNNGKPARIIVKEVM